LGKLFWEFVLGGSGMKLSLVADGELMAPTGAATGEDGAAIGGLHASPKTVGLRALTVVRLKCTFGHCGKF
jgi:hypothetical protein